MNSPLSIHISFVVMTSSHKAKGHYYHLCYAVGRGRRAQNFTQEYQKMKTNPLTLQRGRRRCGEKEGGTKRLCKGLSALTCVDTVAAAPLPKKKGIGESTH
jgi:hypothetical protein